MNINQIKHNFIQSINCDFDQPQQKDLFLMIMNKLNMSDQRNLSSISQSYNKNFIKIVKHIPSYVNFNETESLKKYLGSSFNDKIHLSKAVEIVNRIYEAKKRGIEDTKYGVAFPMDPEIMAYAMQLSQNEIVMEIAGASGENGILLAFSGAKKVYVNDIQPLEMKKFRELRNNLPTDIQEKLEGLESSCMDILKVKPELINKVGVVLCRNLIHFFSNEEQTKFLNDLKKILKPGGRAIFAVNSIYSVGNQEVFDKQPNSTCFDAVQCFVTDFNRSSMPIATIFFKLMPINGNVTNETLANFKKIYLVERNSKTNFKWKANNDQFSLLDKNLQKEINQAYQNHQKMISPITHGHVRVQTNTYRIYNKTNLSSLFKIHGFEVESTFVVSNNGHLVLDKANLFNLGQQIGVVVKKPL